MTGVLPVRRPSENMEETHGERCDHRLRGWCDGFTVQETLRISGSDQRLGENHGTDSPSEFPEGPTLPVM